MAVSPPETRASLILRLPNAADAAAWDEVVAVYGPLVYRTALRQGLQPADAEDLVQEVFTALARSVGQWLERPDRGRFRAWLLRIARNTAVNFLTRRPHRSVATEYDPTRELAEVPAPDDPLRQQFELEYRRAVFHWAAEQVRQTVADTTWEAFARTAIEERPIAEVAEQLGMAAGNVYIARSRVMARLREIVTKFEDAE